VRYLSEIVGNPEAFAGQIPEQKLNLFSNYNTIAQSVFIGCGIDYAPAMSAATSGIAYGKKDRLLLRGREGSHS